MNSDKFENFTITQNDSQKRVDNVIRRLLPKLTLKNVFKAIRNGDIRVNSKKVKQNYKLAENDVLSVYKPLLNQRGEDSNSSNIPNIDKNRIVFENEHILIYNKKAGEQVHGSKTSLDKIVKKYLGNRDSLSFSPGPLHRLDRNTQGLIVFSSSLKGAREFTDLLQQRQIKKFYIAIVDGEFSKKEIWEDNISRDRVQKKSYKSDDGQSAITHFTPLIAKKGKTLALIEIKTGRTHQIRVHCSIHNRPLTGDVKYNSQSNHKDYFLCAISLTFTKNSDILNDRKFTLPLNMKIHPLIGDFFNKEDIIKAESKLRELTQE